MTRHTLLKSYSVLALVLACTGVGCGARDFHPASGPPRGSREEPAGKGNRVVILVIDGLRYTESFGDSTAARIPRLSRELAPRGVLFDDFRNEGTTSTNPGHVSMLTGTWQRIPNDGSARPDKPTIFEYFRSHYESPAGATWMIAGKPKLNVCSYSTDPEYGAPFGATENVGRWGDATVVDTVLAVLRRARPVLLVANLRDVDDAGHDGDWEGYLAAIETADSLVLEVWRALQDDPFYAGTTYLFITTDHGRHDDAHGGFRDHGCSCEGCEHLTLLALGPDVAAGQRISAAYTLRDICATVGEILGCPVPRSEGVVVEEMFVGRLTGAPAAAP